MRWKGYQLMIYSNYIDHTLLKADASFKDIKKLCDEAIKYNFFSVCVNPCYIKKCKSILKNTKKEKVLSTFSFC